MISGVYVKIFLHQNLWKTVKIIVTYHHIDNRGSKLEEIKLEE